MLEYYSVGLDNLEPVYLRTYDIFQYLLVTYCLVEKGTYIKILYEL